MSFIMISCSIEGEKAGSYENDNSNWSSMEYMIEEKTIDDCEYIIIFGVDGRNIIHKANCTNSFHSCN